ncbi:type I polyketide synthase [Allonocardiopsis opalescens]|uniref:Erythronolide synthase/tylactone synthase/type I polyketide synthase PikAII n=1 Tax=Allonocardiopsis opalescens TaxID=1144618 RepID=A0A2T0Q9H1_9ACTN|nr:type I polyketide synthase [Allonocardiopsis opalescens]PRY00462.1 erythronolide synthase/tylactone synthase/type I polyketide synthase PikAII [Allonocardiopsis opalescens]
MATEDEIARYLKRAAVDLRDARARIAELESEPIAITAAACRFPRGIGDPERLWELLDSGGEVVAPLPADRGWPLPGLVDPTGGRPGTSYVGHGGFLDEATLFDAEFFGISPREALAMDPQQRVLLEAAWELTERAGLLPGELRGSPTGVYLGAASMGYGFGGVPPEAEGMMLTGTVTAVASGRLAYVLGLTGPALTIDTACSSSLVALHLAAQALRRGDCARAIVGGVAVMADPFVLVEFSRQRGLSPDGRCRSFAAAADGVGFAEGAALVLVERLADARRAGRPVLAVVRGSAVNQDGASNGLSAPNGTAQQRVIRAALADAGLAPADVDAVEAHGTGTRLGDPVEARALLAVYGRDRDAGRPLRLGSVKSNLGHTQAAAGIAGVLKIALALEHGSLPRTLHVDEPSPFVDWASGAVALVTEPVDWPAGERVRRAGVSAFGISGTNAHVIIEEPPPADPPAPRPRGAVPLVLTAREPGGVRAQAARLAAWLRREPAADPVEVGATLALHRAPFAHRAAVVGEDPPELAAALDALATGPVADAGTAPPRTALVFPGQGAQWPGMALELLERSPEFAAALGEAEAALAPYTDRPVRELLGDAAALERVDVVQPALWAVMVALAALWRHHGVEPDVVIGHSQGEIAAACVAGGLSLADGARVVALRSRAVRALSGAGGMLAVAAPAARVAERIAGHGDRAALAAVNGPAAVVVSGDPAALAELAAGWAAEGVDTRLLPVDYASHSAQVDRLAPELREALAPIRPRTGRVPFHSTVDGAVIDTAGLDADYWVRNLRATVGFHDAVRETAAQGPTVFVECSPHPVLVPAVDAAGAAAVGTLRRGEGGPRRFRAALGEAYARGVAVDWERVFGPRGARPLPLPTYPFRRDRFWIEPGNRAEARADLGYRLAWAPAPEAGEAAPARHRVLVVPAGTAVPDGLEALAGPDPRVLAVDTAAPDRARYAAALRPLLGGPGTEVLSLLALDAASGLPATVALLQALADLDAPAPLRVLTRGGVAAAPGEEPVPEQARYWGLGRTAALEEPEVWGGLIDLPAAGGVPAGPLPAGEDQIALRVGGPLVPSLEPVPLPRAVWRPSGRAVVVGGTPAQCEALAGWLTGHDAVEQVLLTGVPGRPAESVRRLRALGGRVTVEDVDAAEPGALARVLTGPVRAAFHLPAPAEAAPLAGADPAELAAATAARTAGARALHELLAAEPAGTVDALVYFSSVAGLWGTAGRAGYAAGNAYLDALAAAGRAAGLPATAIAWTPWEGAETSYPGLRPLPAETALDLLARAVGGGLDRLAAVDADWPAFREVFAARRDSGFARRLPGAPAPDAVAAAGSEFADTLRGLAEDDRVRAVESVVQAELAAALGRAPGSSAAPTRAFRELGLDSLTAVELRDRLRARTGLPLASTVIFDRPTVRRLAAHLLDEMLGRSAAQPPAAVAAADDDPVVITAAVCRLPGGIRDPESYWSFIDAGRHTVSPFPTDRGWVLRALCADDPAAPGASSTRFGGFLDGAADFDPGFFGISPREALAMDPQQRLLMETAWELFERAGIDPSTLQGGDTGVFVGSNGQFYFPVATRSAEDVWGHLGTGNTGSVMSGRIAYALGLEGPALTVDTACSASLVALHLAVQSVRRGECAMAVAGGVTVMSSPDTFVDFTRQDVLSRDGRCRAYAEGADGVGLAEGVVQVLVERLSAARAAGREVLGVVRGSAVNSDGASNGLTAPSGAAQERVIRAALADARLAPHDVDLVEGHGTGTRLGDPIEAGALRAAYGRGRPADRPLLLGSVKSNIGHTQAAAGLAGVLKVLLALRHERIPATLHGARPSELIEWDGVRPVAEPAAWPAGDRVRRAGVSSFGISGTNAHVVIEEPPPAPPAPEPAAAAGPVPWVLSARSPAALAAQAERLAERVAAEPELDPAAVGHALVRTRTAFEHRAVLIGSSRAELLGGLADLDAAAVTGHAPAPRRVAFVFPGQGAQWPGMAARLLAESPVFAERMEECARALAPHLDWSPLDLLREGGELDRVDVVQPALWAVMVSIAALWRHHGVVPSVVVGHSQGEIAAACVAGGLSLADGARAVALRSRIATRIVGSGGMLSVAAPLAEVRERIAPFGAALDIAVVNSSRSVTVAGTPQALAALAAACERDGLRTRTVPAAYASHSAQVDPLVPELREALRGLAPRPGELAFHSTVRNERVDTAELDAEYWVRNLREPVRFHDAVQALAAQGVTAFVECSPHPVLAPVIEAGEDAVALGTLRRDEGGLDRFLRSLAEAHVHGVEVDWTPAFPGPYRRHVPLPVYPFQHRRFWAAAAEGAGGVRAAGLDATGHPLAPALAELPETGELLLTGALGRTEQPWLADHAAGGTVILPGTAFLELAVAAGDGCGAAVEELTLLAPLELPAEGATQVQVRVAPADAQGRRALAVHARPEGEPDWTRHATGTLAPDPGGPAAGAPAAWPPAGAEPVALDGHYAAAAAAGYGYGPAFRGLRRAWRRGGEVFAEAALPEGLRPDGYVLHPALLDAAVQAVACGDFLAEPERLNLPFAFSGVRVHAAAATELRVRVAPAGPDAVALTLTDPLGAPVAHVDRLRLRPASVAPPPGAHRLDWQPVTAAAPAALPEPVPLERAREAASAGGPLVVRCPEGADGDPGPVLDAVLALLRDLAADERFAAADLVLLTRGAVAAEPDDPAPDPVQASVWGLVRSAQAEHPGRFTLVDLDGEAASAQALGAAVGTGEPQAAVRYGRVSVPRLTAAADPELLDLPAHRQWRLAPAEPGTIGGIAPVRVPERPLGPLDVRVEVRAAGVNFRDVLIALGMYPGEGTMGVELAGVVTATGAGVTSLTPGDRVYGLAAGGFAAEAVTDHRLLAPIPEGWGFAEAASVPAAFLTAWYALRDLAKLRPGETVLVHSAAGGVGMAAVQVANHLGARVLGTASPAKWPALAPLGLTADRLASSRTTEFERVFAEGADVVLNSLTGEFVDASARLLRPGGRFVEMGRTDLRAGLPGAEYLPFELMDAGPDRIAAMLAELGELFERGALAPPPLRAWDIRQARHALTHVSRARHVGKVVLTLPRALDPGGSVLITGAGTLGGLLARHLVTRHGVRHLTLASRSGPPPELVDELTALGADVQARACDAADATALAEVLAGLPRPLTALVHTAGVLDDALLESLTPERVAGVLRPKVAAARHLDALTSAHDPAAVVLYSSSAAVLGGPGQGAYAAANQYLDALAAARCARGRPTRSLGWGFWAHSSGLSGTLSERDRERIAAAGLRAMPTGTALRLFDAALAGPEPVSYPMLLDRAALAARSREGGLSVVLRGLVAAGPAGPARRTAGAAAEEADAAAALHGRLAAAPDPLPVLVDLVRRTAAAVLGHRDTDAVRADAAFRELGFDSLTAVEMRNRLARATGLRLPAALVFDRPTTAAVAAHLAGLLAVDREPERPAGPALPPELARLAEAVDTLAVDAGTAALVERRLHELAAGLRRRHAPPEAAEPAEPAEADWTSDEELFAFLDNRRAERGEHP